MAGLPEDAERVLADDPDGLARLALVLHGRAAGLSTRPAPTRDDRFGSGVDADRTTSSPTPMKRRRATCSD